MSVPHSILSCAFHAHNTTYTPEWFGCKGTDVESRRSINDPVGNVTVLIAYSSIFINPLIYLLQYDVVKRSLINSARNVAAKLRNQQPPNT